MSVFKKAERKQAKLRLGLTGPSGSGTGDSILYVGLYQSAAHSRALPDISNAP